MMEKPLWSFEAVVLLVLLSSRGIYGTDVTINSLSDCGGTYDLNEHSEVNIQFYQKSSSGDCEITIKEHSSDDYPRMCIKPERLYFNGCTLKVEVHMGHVIDGYEDEEYSCSKRSDAESCTYLSTLTVIFKGESSWNDDPVDILLRVYPGESEFIIKDFDTPFSIIIGVICGIGGLVFIIVTIALCCRAARQRANFPQRAAMPSLGVYPQVQYNTVPPQTGGFQPLPPQGYQPPPQGYQPPYQQGFQAPSPQGYQPPRQGYQPPRQGYQPPPHGNQPSPQGYQPPQQGYQSPPQGYQPPHQGNQPPPQGYQPPPQGYQPPLPHGSQPPAGEYRSPLPHGYQSPSQDYGKHSDTGGDHSADLQDPSALPRDEDIPPPPYPSY